eukprot:4812-Heterococcus_DN1.PRE.2
MMFTQKSSSERGGSKAEVLAASKASKLARERLKIEVNAAMKVQSAARGHLSRLRTKGRDAVHWISTSATLLLC